MNDRELLEIPISSSRTKSFVCKRLSKVEVKFNKSN